MIKFLHLSFDLGKNCGECFLPRYITLSALFKVSCEKTRRTIGNLSELLLEFSDRVMLAALRIGTTLLLLITSTNPRLIRSLLALRLRLPELLLIF